MFCGTFYILSANQNMHALHLQENAALTPMFTPWCLNILLVGVWWIQVVFLELEEANQ